ncbi:MAG: D-alanine--D-alanine ligase family protein [Candidatus Dormibacteria bacterium]
MTSTRRVGVVFGGRSVEHEVSVISAHQAMAALPTERYTVVPVYIAKDGRWFTGAVLRELAAFADPERLLAGAEPVQLSTDPAQPGLLRLEPRQRRGLFGRGPSAGVAVEPLDCVLPLVHGSHGEDGTLQGLCELADIAYAGCDVTASAVCMDKALTKTVLRAANLPVLDDLTLSRAEWRRAADAGLTTIEERFRYPLFVKPMTLGSSIGVARAPDRVALRTALEVAFTYDSRVLLEPSQGEIIEVNCAVLGDGADTRVSVCEQPVAAGLLRYEDKYGQGRAKTGSAAGSGAKTADVGGKGGAAPAGMDSARRIVPAPIAPELTASIQEAARRAFAVLGCAGVSRVDFLVRPDAGWFVLNEINPVPGSLAFYLFEPAGLHFADLVAELVELGLRRHAAKRESTYSIDSWLLREARGAGSKAAPPTSR